MKPHFLLAAILFFTTTLSYGAAHTHTDQIVTMYAYSSFGDGDVTFKLENMPTPCEGGYWLRKTDKGFDGNLSILLSAFHANTALTIVAFDHELWTGSASPYCLIDGVGMNK